MYMPFLAFGVLQNEGLSETDLLRIESTIGPGERLFAAYASSHCGVPIRNKIYALLEKYKNVHGLNKNCHNGLQPPGGLLSDRYNETSWMISIVERFKEYKFVLVFENQIVPGYLTEKLANAKKAGAVPVYWGSSAATDMFNSDAFVNCSPFVNETEEDALSRCVSQVVQIDKDNALWFRMVNQPFVREGQAIDYKPVGAIVRGILECKRLGDCGNLTYKEMPVCQHIIKSTLLRQAFFVPPHFGGCAHHV